MNKTILWIIVAIIVIGGIWYFVMNGSGSGAPGSNATSTSQASSSGTMKDLIARGSSQCQVTDPSNGSSGTVYVGGGKMRGDFTSQTSSGTTITSHMISDGQTVYVWSSAMPQGIKMAVSASSQTSASGTQNPYNENVNYTCSAWSVNSSEFALPAGVTFEDMSAMIQGSAGASTGASAGNAAQCSACDQAPNATAKAQCRAALQCK